MSVKSEQDIVALFSTANASTGAAADATGTPTGTLYVNGTANGATVTVTNLATGLYKAAVTLPSLTAGDVVSLRVAATVSSVAGEGVIWQEVADTERVSDLNDLDAAGIRTAVGLGSANLDTQLGDVPTVSEFNARTLAAADYFDWTADTVANVTAVGSVTGAVGSVTGAVGSVTGAVGSVTGNVGGNVTGSVGSVAAGGITAASIATDAIDADAIAANAVTEIQSGLATAASIAALNNLSQAQAQTAATAALNAYDPPTKAELDSAVAPLATQVSVNDIPTNAELAAALASADDAVLAAIAALKDFDPATDTVANVTTTGTVTNPVTMAARTVEAALDEIEALRLILAAVAGKATGGGTTTITFRDTADTKDRIVATVDSDGNRSNVVIDAS